MEHIVMDFMEANYKAFINDNGVFDSNGMSVFCAFRLNHYEWLDNPEHFVFEFAFDISTLLSTQKIEENHGKITLQKSQD